MASQNTRRLGKVCRIYKNAASQIIALESVEINVSVMQLADLSFFRSVTSTNTHRTLLHLTTSASRVVASIQVMGDYSSIEENGGDFLIATWDASSANENDVVVSLGGYVAKIGDTV